MGGAFRIAVLISGAGTNLQALIDTLDDSIEIVAVASSRPGAAGLQRAEQAGIETAVFAVADHAGREERDAALGDWLEERRVDLVVLAGFMEVLGRELIGRFAGRVINVHPSLLPAFPGVGAIDQALRYGVKTSGVTVHFVDEGVDTGPIILQEAVALPYPGSIAAIEELVHRVEHRLLPRAVRLIADGRVRGDRSNPRVILVDDGD